MKTLFNNQKTSLAWRLLFLFLLVLPCSLSAQKTERYVVLVSMDGFRYDYSQMYRTPFLDSLGHAGVWGQMRPSFPSKTFPNHYTLCTGLVPNNHGIVANHFIHHASGRRFSLSDPATKFDGSFYGGEPLWITAQRQGINCGVVYWPGSDTEIHGVRPFSYQTYDGELLSFEQRIERVRQLLTLPEDVRPHLILSYYSEPDATGHRRGPCHPETRAVVEHMDTVMHQLYDMLQSLPIAQDIDLIIVSDHGMTYCAPERFVPIFDYIKPEWVEVADYSVPVLMNPVHSDDPNVSYADSILQALSEVPHLRAYRRQDVPACLQYGSNPNIGELVIIPDVGWTVAPNFKASAGEHGFDPFANDMLVPFKAIGPDFKQNYHKEEQFQNINVYPLVCHLLGLEMPEVDGRLEVLQDILR